MPNVYMLLARGFEESEAIVPADLLKRADANVVLVATEGGLTVPSAHGFILTADITFDELRRDDIDCLILPGGAMGTKLLGDSTRVADLIEYCANNGITIGAICAAPSILGKMQLLNGRKAAVYPGFDEAMKYANVTGKKVEHDDIFITAEGMGVSFEFGLKLVEVLFGNEKAQELRQATRFPY